MTDQSLSAAAASAPLSLGALGCSLRAVGGHGERGLRILWLAAQPAASSMRGGDDGALCFTESRKVPVVHVKNRTAEPRFLPSGTILLGGLQTRMSEHSVVIGPGALVDLLVRCVEKGRWAPQRREGPRGVQHSGQGSEAEDGPHSVANPRGGDASEGGAGSGESAGSELRIGGRAGCSLRAAAEQSKARSYRRSRAYASSQSDVWTHVESELSERHLQSHTSSYEAVIGSRRARPMHPPEALDAAPIDAAPMSPPDAACGALIAGPYGGAWLEIFATHDMLARALPDLLADIDREGAPFEPSVPMEPNRALERALATPLQPVDQAPTPGTLGTHYVASDKAAHGALLLVDGELTHLQMSFY